MSIEKRLRLSVRFDSVNGDEIERGICARQMLEAANEIARLRADAKRVTTNYEDLAHEIWSAAQCCPPTGPIAEAVARIVALLHGAFPRVADPDRPKPVAWMLHQRGGAVSVTADRLQALRWKVDEGDISPLYAQAIAPGGAT